MNYLFPRISVLSVINEKYFIIKYLVHSVIGTHFLRSNQYGSEEDESDEISPFQHAINLRQPTFSFVCTYILYCAIKNSGQ